MSNFISLIALSMSWLPGSRSAAISTLTDLKRIQDHPARNYFLLNDIDATPTSRWNDQGTDTSTFEGWKPFAFSGRLDGKGHTIKGLTIRRPNQNAIGLFSELTPDPLSCRSIQSINQTALDSCSSTKSTQIKDLVLQDAEITGGNQTGGLAGESRNTLIVNVKVSGNISGQNMVGGLVGLANPWNAIISSSSSAHLTGRNDVGGLIGSMAYSRVDSSTTSGSISAVDRVGGIAGSVYESRIRKNTSNTSIHARDSVGGILGIAIGPNPNPNTLPNFNSSYNQIQKFYGENSPQDQNYAFVSISPPLEDVLIHSLDTRVSESVFSGQLIGRRWCGGIRGACRNRPLSLVRCINSGVISGESHVGGISGSSNDRSRHVSLIQSGVIFGDSSAGVFGDSASPISDLVISSPKAGRLSCADLFFPCNPNNAAQSFGYGEKLWSASVFPDGLWGREEFFDTTILVRYLQCDRQSILFQGRISDGLDFASHNTSQNTAPFVLSSEPQQYRIGYKYDSRFTPPMRVGKRVLLPRDGCTSLAERFKSTVPWDTFPIKFSLFNSPPNFVIRADSLCRIDSIPTSTQPVILEVRSSLGGLLRLIVPPTPDMPDTTGYLRSCPLWPEGMP